MKELILQLAEENAPAGSERALQGQLLAAIKDVADTIEIDRLGNGIARKAGQGPHILLMAHADEPGVMIIDIDSDGFLRLVTIGNLTTTDLLHQQVLFTNGVVGLIELEADVSLADASVDRLYVDIGASSQAEAEKRVYVGLSGVVVGQVRELGETRLAGRALDNRAGCAIALQAFRELAAENRQVTLVYTAQSVVGGRGARTAAYQLQPDLALIIDAAPTGDTPGEKRTALVLGKGPAIKIMDGTAIVPLAVKNHLIEVANAQSIPVQYEVWPRGGADAGAVQLAVDGIAIGGVSYPARHVGRAQTVVDLADLTAAQQLIVAAARSFPQP